ncbi:hypothetical protein LTR53_017912, partial [Teratosphaeriaceae sp. CCFEE 6253]
FRARLRADWRRHVSRAIASGGGSLEQQMQLADEHAFAESLSNPHAKKMEQVNAVDDTGRVSQLTLVGELTPKPTSDDTLELDIEIIEQLLDDHGNPKAPDAVAELAIEQPATSAPQPARSQPTVPPFRDPQWEHTEGSYLRTAVAHLNSLTRSYNLMAPDLAKKPYFSLERELRTCFADVAPGVAGAIRERALAPKIRGVEVVGHRPGGVLDRFSMDKAAQVHDERKPQYGFRQFWQDLFTPRQ